eukprot:CAMPEP_0197613336 /NCGR_PEP_ID=MMETSP1326-20131121/58966_1 /TAXON_ID=1155430 /ORGANISM="Genus nov. species nov., Strain RCC2288" /LENGTH=793 /DNA_ID=CAMNT_0043182195 /DNA_START=165 /DNA_END=2546 /DNA_ORIENTATION=-
MCSCPLFGRQLSLISAFPKRTSVRVVPPHLIEETENQAHGVVGSSTVVVLVPDIHSTHQFYHWYTELDVRKKVEWDERFRCHAEVLKQNVTLCDRLLQKADETQAFFVDLRVSYRSIKCRGQALQFECARLVTEKKRLLEFAEVLNHKLGYFCELEMITQTFHVGLTQVGGDDFTPLLHRLDDCFSFINSRPQYAEYAAYSLKCGQLRSRALSAVRSHVFDTLRGAVTQVRQMVREGGDNSNVTIAESALTSLTSVFYVKFRSAISCLRPIMDDMDTRARLSLASCSRREYAQVILDCRANYCEQRLTLILGITRKQIVEYSMRHPLLVFIRTGCAYLLQICRAERELFECAFPLEIGDGSSALWMVMEPLGSILHDAIRPQYILLNDFYTVAELVDVLSGEVLEEQVGRHGEAGTLMQPFVESLLADVRERLIFRAQAFIREEVGNYRPSADDLNYPGRLESPVESHSSSAAINIEIRPLGKKSEIDVNPLNSDKDFIDKKSNVTTFAHTKYNHRWFPPLEHTLSCLATLYRCLDARTFSGLAQEAVQLCSESIQAGSRAIMRQTGNLDGQLFAIKHLLVLREQIAPFEPDLAAYSIPVKELDFSHMRGQMRRMLAGELSLFSTSSDANALLVLAAKGAPRVVELTIDSRRDLERHLRMACEAYIMSVTRLIVEPMLSFITKVTAVRVSGTLDDALPICAAAFATPERLAEIVARVNDALISDLPACVAKMSLYLTGTTTREIIFNPIKSNIAEAHSQIAALLEAEYQPKAVHDIILKSPFELAKLMDAIVL